MHFNPLAITSRTGFDALAAFTSIERAKKAFFQYPEYGYALVVDTYWFLSGAYANAGFALNPGWAYGFELPPEGLRQLLIRYDSIKHRV